MLKKHKNEFLQHLRTLDINLGDFDISSSDEIDQEDTDITSQVIVTHRSTQFCFCLRNDGDNWNNFDVKYSKFEPDFPMGIEPENDWNNFNEACAFFDVWLKDHLNPHLYEIHEPDLIEIFNQSDSRPLLSQIDFSANEEKFTESESAQITLGIKEIKHLIEQNFEFSASQMKLVDDRLRNLELEAAKQTKGVWKSQVVSTVISIIIALSLSTEHGRALMSLFSKVIEGLRVLSS